jgi:FkbM family methyltransferase
MRSPRQWLLETPMLRRRAAGLLYGDRDTPIDLFGTKLVVNTVEENGYYRLSRYLSRSRSLTLAQEVVVITQLALLMEDGDTFIDVGANVGLYACTIARRLKLRPSCNWIYAFEPNPATFLRLTQSCQPFKVSCNQIALSDQKGMLEFVAGGASNTFTTVANSTAQHMLDKRISIPSERLDQIPLAGERFVIKIDVEGQEHLVLKGAEGLFETGRVKAVYVDGYADATAVEGFLTKHGFRLFDAITLDEVSGGHFNLLAMKREVHQIGNGARP